MAVDKPENYEEREPQQRIGELEDQVKELSGLVEILLNQRKQDLQKAEVAEVVESTPQPAAPTSHLVEDVRDGLGRALGGEAGESLESRIGGIWLSRIVAVLYMTLLVLGGVITLQDESIGPEWKIGIGLGVSALAIAYGFYRRRSESFFPQTILGSGLAALYFTVYASFFVENVRLFDTPLTGIAVLAATLVAIAYVAHLRRSATAAGVSLFLIYYTVALSLATSPDQESVTYALIIGALLAVVALVFHATHRWLLFSWGALVATQLTYIYFFVISRPAIEISDQTYFWYSNGFLTLIFCVFSTASITDAWRTGEFRKTVAPMAGVNSFVYLALTWISVRSNYPEFEWAFRLGQTGLFLVFMQYARIAGENRNYLFQIFAAKSLVIFTLALQAYLSHEWLLVAMALECFALGFSYMRSGLVMFKLLGMGLAFVTFLGCLFTAKIADEIQLVGYTVQAKWFTSIAVPLVFSFVAWFYAHFIRRVAPEDREVKGQWFLADTWLDLKSSTIALLHASAGALILMSITIIELGDSPVMPYVLAGEGIAMALVGLLLATPQVEVASVLLVIASHVCFHIFLWIGMDDFEAQPNYVLYTSILVAVTYLGGFLWERYLRRIQGGTQLEHDAMASIPALAATVMLATLMERNFEAFYAPLGQLVLASVLFFIGVATLLVGLRVAGVLALALGTSSYYLKLYDSAAPSTTHPDFVMGVVVALLCYAACERATAFAGRREQGTSRSSDAVRTLIVAIAALLGAFAFRKWAPMDQLSFYWLAHAMGAMILGVIFRESRYRWAGIALYVATAFRFLIYDLANVQSLLRFLIAAALTLPGIIMVWGYSEYRENQLRRLREGQRPQPLADDTTADG